MARPRLKVDTNLISELACLHVPKADIARIVGCSVDTLDRRFADFIDKGTAEGKIRLRRLQVAAAERGNVTMLIWLGKQLLGQKDQPESEIINIDLKSLSDSQLERLARGEDHRSVLKKL